MDELKNLPASVNFPLFVKGRDVNTWRKRISGNVKGFRIENKTQLNEKLKEILLKGVPVIMQEIIEGPDTNHFKYNTYLTKEGNIAGEFALQKIRQNPPHFGVGAVVQSLEYPELIELGRKLFKGIEYRGIGSAEFKKDERDGRLKLIEINPRYWQQNYLATYCGVNFPYYNYADLTGTSFKVNSVYKANVKWINRQLDFDSFVKYRKESLLTFKSWRTSRKGEKVISDFTWSDPIPALYNIKFGLKLFKAPLYLIKKIL
jgi:predicted ATP-grasp superfamily ATP-dependent carboligase